jgi:hypothetical protein
MINVISFNIIHQLFFSSRQLLLFCQCCTRYDEHRYCDLVPNIIHLAIYFRYNICFDLNYM